MRACRTALSVRDGCRSNYRRGVGVIKAQEELGRHGSQQKRRDILVIDTETTGIDPTTDSIVEIGACLLEGATLRQIGSFSRRVRPESPMSASAARIHGLSDAVLSSAPPIRDALVEFSAFAPASALLAGHNICFDVSHLKSSYKCARMEYPFDYHSLDIWSLAFFCHRLRPSFPAPVDLDALVEHFGLQRSLSHSALEDATIAADVLRIVVRQFSDPTVIGRGGNE